MDDLISRQAAITVIHSVMYEFFDFVEEDEQAPMTYTDKRLLELNKAITSLLKDLKPVEQNTCDFWDAESNICALHRPSNGYTKEYTIEDMSVMRHIGYLEGKESAQPEQQWIPVTERMPEPNKIEENGCLRYYLTQNEYGDMMVCSWNGFKWEQIFQYDLTYDEIVAWMPLPVPWKGGAE